jgi:hypothetical protein
MGVIQKLLTLVYSPLTAKEKAAINGLVEESVLQPRTGERARFPRTNFSRGMMNLTLLTVNEWICKVQVTVILAKSKKGSVTMKQAFTRQQARANLAKIKIVQEKEVLCTSSYEGVTVNEMIFVQDEEDSDNEGEDGGQERNTTGGEGIEEIKDGEGWDRGVALGLRRKQR